ncbi:MULTISPECIES: hypothetical protein [Bacillus]|uniref:hypothetical protein n=1 Tax=Bacillus TaxID=1386 RepID=UPI0002D43D67|nr:MULTISPECIES: hypothetical protein [Bacillus]
MLSEKIEGKIYNIEGNVVTFSIDGTLYDFPKQMLPKEAKVNDIILISKESVKIVDKAYN